MWDNKAKKDKTLYDIQIDEATIYLDALSPDDKPFLKYLKKHNIKMKVLTMNGPGGGQPEVKLTGKRKDLERVVVDYWDDEGLKDYIEEGKLTEADLSGYSLSDIASEIGNDWKKISPHAAPYLDAMGALENITDNYFMDSGVSIVAYFLSNASSWRGSVAKDIKKELNKRLKDAR
jgi:hypothetical protein